MREEKILDAMAFLDEEILEEANQLRQGKGYKVTEKPLWIKWRKGFAVIAALFLITLGLFNFIPKDKGELIYGEAFSGYAGCGVLYSKDDLELTNFANPWLDNGVYIPATLPVYKNLSYNLAGEPSGLNDEKMVALLNEAARALDLEVMQVNKEVNPRNPERVFCYYADVDNTKIEVEADGLTTITFKDPIEVKDDFSEAYAELLGFEEPIISESSEGNYIVFDGKGTLTEDMTSYFFGYAEFYTNEEGKLSIIRIHNELMATEKIGEYFYISNEEAKEKLHRGEFYTNSGYGIYEKSPIVKTDMVYINSRYQEYFMPYYRFFVKVEDEGLPNKHNYGIFYVPAVSLDGPTLDLSE